MSRYFFTLLLSLVALFSYSQQVVTFTVKNFDTKEVLPFCNVGIEGSGLGGITNEDGVITMKIPESYSTATISISHIGYEPQKIKISDIGDEKRVVYLKESAYILPEVEISSNDDEWFKILNKCRSVNIKQKNISRAKAFYSIESTKDDLPLEVVECFYNADINGLNVKDLAFKNGKLFLNKSESGWRTLNASETYKGRIFRVTYLLIDLTLV